ncbi:MAG: AAA family ATPase, partial [Neisseriaceae bacterium]|nr:AAA family ATPase [Neisseriaceae bacterium]
VYRSRGYLVKAWIGTDPQRDEQKARVVFNWLKQVDKLYSLSPDYLPKIHEFGIAKKSSCLFMVSDFIDGDTWKNTCQNNQLSDEQKQSIIHQLVSSIEHLHSLGLTHGDLKPDNVLLTFDEDNIQLHILDILDFSPTGETLFNTAYSPEFDDATEKQRDNFAVMKMAYELWQSDEIDEAINREYQDDQTAFIALDRFKEVFTPKAKTPMVDITIGGQKPFSPISIYPENGELFVQFKSSEKHPNQVIIIFIGLGGKFTAFYIIDEQKFGHALTPNKKDYITRQERDNSNLSLSVGFNIKHTQHGSNLSTLDDFIKNNEVFQNAIKQFIAENSFRLPETNGVQIFDEQIDETVITVTDEITDSDRPKIQDLWQAILDTETEALPYIIADDEPKHTENEEIYIVYDGEIDPLDQFERDDIVEAIGISEDGEKTFKYGTVDLSKSQLNKIHLKNHNHHTYSIQTDTPIYFQSKLSKASFIRRKNALQRILNKESVIKNLADYFDENCELLAENYHIKVTDEQFSRYDQPEKNIRLNDAQRTAFQCLIDNGPLSLLQGPPGTGKTEFIAAFVHYLFDVQKVRNILLVSQSHEAVNTAAERIRKHCKRLGTDLQLVRFSNREVADSEILEDVFSPNLVGQKRQQLNVNKIDNICSLGRTMGLPEKYLRERAEIIFGIGQEIRRYQKIVHSD